MRSKVVNRLDERVLDKIDVDYFNIVYDYKFESVEKIPTMIFNSHVHVPYSSRLMFLCNHLNRYKNKSLQDIAIRYGISKRNTQLFINAQKQLESMNLRRVSNN